MIVWKLLQTSKEKLTGKKKSDTFGSNVGVK